MHCTVHFFHTVTGVKYLSSFSCVIRASQHVCDNKFCNLGYIPLIVNYLYIEFCTPLHVQNGQVLYNTSLSYGIHNASFISGYSVGTMASFSCDEHNIREGSSSATCQNSGMWSEQPPICNQSNENEN